MISSDFYRPLIHFQDAMKYPYNNVYSITCYDQVDKCVHQVFYYDFENGLSVALSYGYDFIEIEDMERHICVPQNVHQSALALQALQTVLHDAGVIYPITNSKWVAPIDTTKESMSSSKCRSVEVINSSARPGSNHREVNCINYK